MEAPDKIWINPLIDLPKLSGVIDKDSIQYVRKDALIKKAIEWLQDNFLSFNDDDVEDFKKYMKGE